MSFPTVQESPAPYGRAPRTRSQRGVILHGVSWGTYESLVSELGEHRKTKFAYNDGELEIMAPLYEHEDSNWGIGSLILILAEELGLKCQPAGALTCKRKDLKKAIEPDCCFYIQHAKDVSGLKDIKLPQYPPPDLMVEIDVSSKSMNKLPICSALGVPEHWRYDENKLEIRVLRGDQYILANESDAFPGLPLAKVLPEYIESGRADFIAMMRNFRKWVRAQLKSKKPARRSKKS